MGRLDRRPQATRDLKDIWRYIAADSESSADRWAEKIEAICIRLSKLPLSGRSRPDFGTELRSVPCGNYLVIYRALPDGIELVRVLHGARDLNAIFDREA